MQLYICGTSSPVTPPPPPPPPPPLYSFVSISVGQEQAWTLPPKPGVPSDETKTRPPGHFGKAGHRRANKSPSNVQQRTRQEGDSPQSKWYVSLLLDSRE